jgi:homoserine O-acetyltransferase
MGMISYRTAQGYHTKFNREIRQVEGEIAPVYGSKAAWQVKSYLEYQGIKFVDRFDPITYVKLTEQMDSHDISRNRGSSVAEVLERIEIPACVLGIDSDVLYPLSEQEEIAKSMPNAELKVIHSDDGHDGFLLEQDQVGRHIVDFLDRHN